MKRLKPIAVILLSITLLLLICASCNKRWFKASCYDKALYEEYKNRACTMDCPGVIGCDGKEYCNACIAATQGIRVK